MRMRAAAGVAGLVALLGASCTSAALRSVRPPAAPAPASSPPSPTSSPVPVVSPSLSPLARLSPSPSPLARPSPVPSPLARRSASPDGAAGSSSASPGCPANLAAALAATHGASELITVDDASSASTYATVTLWSRSGSCWLNAGGPWTGRVGAGGVSDHHREGDGSTPAGAYGVGSVIYGIAADPGVAYAYHQLACGDWWDEDPTTPAYNTFQHVACGQAPPFGGGSEALWTETVAYQHFVVVDYNTDPVVPGAGSGVFIHDDVGGPTAGCVSLPPADLDVVLHWLSPAKSPLAVIGTDAEIRRF